MLIHNPKELAAFVISQRKKMKLSQSTVADLVGLKQKTISAFENKPENTKLSTIFRILAAVNLDLTALPRNSNVLMEPWKEEW